MLVEYAGCLCPGGGAHLVFGVFLGLVFLLGWVWSLLILLGVWGWSLSLSFPTGVCASGS